MWEGETESIYIRRHSVRTSLERKHGGRNSYLLQNNQKSEMLLMINRKPYKKKYNEYKYILFSMFIGQVFLWAPQYVRLASY